MKYYILFILVLIFTSLDAQIIHDSTNNIHIDYLTMNQKIEEEKYKEVLSDCRILFEKYPESTWPFQFRAEAKYGLNDYRGAINDFTKAINFQPKQSLYYGRACAKYEIKDYKGALSDCNESVEINKNNEYPQIYSLRGNIKYSLKNLNGACLDWSKAGELGSNVVYELIRKYCN